MSNPDGSSGTDAAPGAADLSAVVPDAARTEELKPAIVAAISTVYDPEIPVNIWELGLIYDIIVDAAGVAGVRMTLTAPGCPAAQSLPVEVADKVKKVAGRDRREGRGRVGTGLDEGSDVRGGETAVGIVVTRGPYPLKPCYQVKCSS